MSREMVKVYQPENLEKAKKLFEKFKQMNLENLDEGLFFFLFEKGNGDVGFCVKDNRWQVIEPQSNGFFDVELVEI